MAQSPRGRYDQPKAYANRKIAKASGPAMSLPARRARDVAKQIPPTWDGKIRGLGDK